MTFVRLVFLVRSLDLFCHFTRVYEGHFMLCIKQGGNSSGAEPF